MKTNINPLSLHETLILSSSTLALLPKLEVLINKEEPTLEDILEICSHDEDLLGRLTRRSGFGSSRDEFAKEILFRKGLGFLKSLAIRTMNQEIFVLPLGLNGITTQRVKRRAIILARFLRHFSKDLLQDSDNLYLAGLLYNFSYVSYEHLKNQGQFCDESFEEVESETLRVTVEALTQIGFDSYVLSILEDSVLEIQQTRNPCEHALLRIANGIIEKTELGNVSIGRRTPVDRNLLDMTGYSEKEILNLLKELSRNYQGGSLSSQSRTA